jgi:hypothetical protein
MGTKDPLYYIRGTFEGHFRTKQNDVLSPNDPFPEGDTHKVIIYRGIISQSESLTIENYQNHKGKFEIEHINNVQINTSNKWPLANDRVFILNKAKLTNIEFSNVQNIDNKTYGEIKGDIVAKVYNGNYEITDNNLTNNEDFNIKGNEDGIYVYPEQHNGGGGANDDGNSTGITNRWAQLRGCASWDFSWLRWLLYILLILLMLYLLGKCTQIGQKIYCEIADWSIENERQEVQDEMDTIYKKIEATIQRNTPCGYTKEYSGGQQPYAEIRNLGTQSGKVEIIFDAKGIPDRIEVIYDGKLVNVSNDKSFEPWYGDNLDYLIDLGFTQYKTVMYFDYTYQKNKPTELLVRVIPNKKYADTEWTLDIKCPE